jgi:hypothetical protein
MHQRQVAILLLALLALAAHAPAITPLAAPLVWARPRQLFQVPLALAALDQATIPLDPRLAWVGLRPCQVPLGLTQE